MKHLLFMAALSRLVVAQNIEGIWQGTLTNQNREIQLAFKITKNGDAYQGSFYNLANGRQFNLGAVTLQGTAIKIVIPGNGMTYEGKIETNGNSITGSLIQGANPTPLPLKRATTETAWALPPPPAPPKGLPENSKLEFEVAAIKPAPPGSGNGGFNVTATEFRGRTTLADFITFAFNIHRSQIAGLPGWAATEPYEIVATLPRGGDATDPQLFKMMQNLIQTRFNLSFHTENRELSVYTVSIGKNGPAGIKMVKNTTNGARVSAQGLGRTTFSGMTMADFARQLQQRVLDRPVVDRSGLTDRYDFTLNWTPDEFQFPNVPAAQRAAIPTGPGAPPDLFTAIQEQLGMKLEVTKAPLDVMVIDTVSRPSEN